MKLSRCRIACVALLALSPLAAAAARAQDTHHHGVDHVDRAVGAVRAPAAGVQEGDRHRRARWSRSAPGRRSTSAGAATPTCCSCTTSAAEEKFVAEGFGRKRYPVMYNDFVLVGPKSDPAGVKGNDIVAALKKIAAANAPFISRGDKSGTHAAELRYWKAAGIDAPADKGSGYKECGCGMGPALNIARVEQRLRAHRPRHLAQLQEPRRPRDPRRGRQAPVQPVRRDARRTRRSTRT